VPDSPRTPESPSTPAPPPTSTPQAGPGSPARVRVALPASLTAPEPAEETSCAAATVRELLDALAAVRPGLAGRLLHEGRPLVTVAVNGTVLPAQTAMARALADGDRIELVPPVAGG